MRFKDLKDLNIKLYLFWIQGVFSVIVISFCFAMLIRGGEICEYIAVITGVLGYWLPSPNYSEAFAKKPPTESNQGKKYSYISNNNIIIESHPTKRKLSLDSALESYKTPESFFELPFQSPNIRQSLEKIVKKK
jgi:hypothetical protein